MVWAADWGFALGQASPRTATGSPGSEIHEAGLKCNPVLNMVALPEDAGPQFESSSGFAAASGLPESGLCWLVHQQWP